MNNTIQGIEKTPLVLDRHEGKFFIHQFLKMYS